MAACLAALVVVVSAHSLGESACEALNKQRNIDTHRTNQVTKAVLCDTSPAACVSEFLFSHEFYWSASRAARIGGIKCARWTRDEDWPTDEPHLSRPAGLGVVWESVLRSLPNRTLWLHGDSIMTQVCEAAICSLLRSGVVPTPPLCTGNTRHPTTSHCSDVDALSQAIGMQLRALRLPNGARLVCSAVGVFEREKIAAVLTRLNPHVAVVNYGLHYHTTANFGHMLDQLFGELSVWKARAAGRVPLFRELSAQHFKGGAWTPGAHKPPPGVPCQCEPLNRRGALAASERTLHNQNVEFNAAAAAAAAAKDIGLVPFFNLTAPRHNMHRRHFCSFSNQVRVGSCCDCTHFCYTPLFWDHFFAGLGESIRAHPAFDGPRAPEPDSSAVSRWPRRRRRSRQKAKGKGRGRGRARTPAGRRWRQQAEGAADRFFTTSPPSLLPSWRLSGGLTNLGVSSLDRQSPGPLPSDA